MSLVIGNKLITAELRVILKQLQKEAAPDYFREMTSNGDNIVVTCPYHKNGQEAHASCRIFNKQDDPNVAYGFLHCFTCGKKATLPELVEHCFNETKGFGNEWLSERFGNTIIEKIDTLIPITLTSKSTQTFIAEEELKKFNTYHPYLQNRGISKTILDKYNIGFDKQLQAVTFPVWDEHNRLVMITKRSINHKTFFIDEHIKKPVYLLNKALMERATTVYVCESQINALTLATWGYTAVALIGTGTPYQLNILNSCGILHYVLCLDGDSAGDKGIAKIKKYLKKDIIVDVKTIPRGKDINDLTHDEFKSLPTSFI